jgi:hypothetical protein
MAARTRRDMQRWARRGSTAERGYGSPHRAERERRLLLYRPGDLCAHGGEPLLWWPLQLARRYLDLPHTADRSGYLPGLSCRRHNRAEGATRGNRMRGRARMWQQARRW